MLFGFKFWVTGVAVATLAACGGGGGGGGSSTPTPVASTNAFNLQSGLATLANGGFSKTFTMSGSCTGTLGLTDTTASTSVTFEATSAFSATETVNSNLFGSTTCSSASGTATTTRYYNTSYVPLGFNGSGGGSYGVYSPVPTFTTTAHVGDTVTIGTVNLYTDSTKATFVGHYALSYAVTADTATTAILNMITKVYDSSSVLTSTEQDYYRISATGTLTPIALDILYTSGFHLVGN